MSAPAKKSSADTKEKDLMLDKDMEKDTWNFKSMTDDDPMDFGFNSPAKNKKNAFKLDLGFDLDGDFGNMSSFKMDMPDFDFSSPAKKTTKAKESSDDQSSGKSKPKKDPFSFSFDFNALDDFSLDPSLPKKGSDTTTKTMDSEETAAGRKFDQSDAMDFELDLPVTRKAASKAKTDVKADATNKTMDCKETASGRKLDQSYALDFHLDLPVTGKAASKAKTDVKAKATTKTMDCEETASGRKLDKSDAFDFGPDLPVTHQATSKEKRDVKINASAEKENQVSKTTDTMVADNSTHSKQDTLESMENSEAAKSPQSPRIKTSRAQTMCLRPQSVITLPSKTLSPITEEIDEPCASNETASFSPSDASETAHTAVSRETSPEFHEICSSGTKEDSPQDPDQSAYSKTIPTMESDFEKTEPNVSSKLRMDKNEHQQEETATATQAEIADETRRTLCDPDTEYSEKHLSGKISSGTRPSQTAKVQDSVSEPPLASSHSVMGTYTQTQAGDQTRKDPNAGNSQTTFSRKIPSGTFPSQTAKVQDSGAILSLAPSQSVLPKDTQAEGDQTRRTLHDPGSSHSQTTLSERLSPGTCPSQSFQIQDSSSKLPLAQSHSMPGLKDMKTVQKKDSGLIRSRFFKKPEQPESDVRESSPARTESLPVCRERKGLISNSTDDRSPGIKDALPGSNTKTCRMELVNTDSEMNAANVNTSSSHEKKTIHKDYSKVKTGENVAGLLDRSKMQAENTTREMSMLQINTSSKLDASSLTQKLSKHLSSGAESSQKSKIVSLERPKLGNISSDLRAAKNQRTIGVNKGQPSPTLQPELNPSINNERKTEAPVKRISEIHHLTPRDKTQTLHCPSSLKRKALDEGADRSLKPQLKRLAMSPRENRNVEDLTHRAVLRGNANSPTVNNSPRIMNMADLEIPITENDDKAKKAETYSKDLENICNILKKKHEEAKELLVRAVVNNNKLLMLNHPLYEDKIRMVQKFAAKLTSNEQQHMMQTQTTVA